MFLAQLLLMGRIAFQVEGLLQEFPIPSNVHDPKLGHTYLTSFILKVSPINIYCTIKLAQKQSFLKEQ